MFSNRIGYGFGSDGKNVIEWADLESWAVVAKGRKALTSATDSSVPTQAAHGL